MPMRLSGLMSGMDTESIISQLVEARKTKVTKAVKAQKSLKYKQDAWKDLNKQILNLYNKSLSNMRFESSFIKKTTKVSNSNVVSVITGDGAMNSVQTLEVEELAKTGYLTGGQLGSDVTADTKLSDLGFTGDSTVTVSTKDGDSSISVNGDTTIGGFVKELQKAGLNANFDEGNKRIFVAAKTSGEASDFSIVSSDLNGLKALSAMKLSYTSDALKKKYKEIFGGETAPDKIMQKKLAVQTKRREELKGQLDALNAEETKLKDEQEDLFDKIKGNSVVQSTLDKISKSGADYDKLTAEEKASLASALGKADYSSLSQEEKDALGKAVSQASDIIKEDGVLTEEDKKAAADLISGWETNSSALERNASSLKSVRDKLVFDASGNVIRLGDEEKKAISKRIDDAVAVYEKLENEAQGSGAMKTDGTKARILLNGMEYTSDKNTFEINGLTLTVNATTKTTGPVTITTEDDTNGIYDMIKNFFKEYNTLINRMDKLYNADSAKGYDPLTDEEKEAMSDSAIEEWENKIKDSILRKDSSLSTISGAMKQIMMEGVEVNGKKMYLSNFGINTLNYFSAPDNERNAYHIDGDPDDENTSGNADKLKSMIANDPDTVVSFFTQLSKNLYNEMFEKMKGREGYSSAMTAYDDKKMQKDYDDYTTKIKELEKKLADYEDKWYAKFAAMETALAKMQNNASAVTSLLGG